MLQEITPISHAIDASITIPGSKSITNRALLLAALAQGESHLSGVLLSEDSEAFAAGLNALGVGVRLNKAESTAVIQGQGGLFLQSSASIYCKDAGTATRFLIPACAASQGQYAFSASPRMQERPIAPLLAVLEAQGARFAYTEKSGHMPFVLHAQGLAGGEVYIDITQSSQFLSGLLMSAPYAHSPMRLAAGTLSNKPYVTMTLEMMREFGVETLREHDTIYVPQGCYQAQQYVIEPDASTASYFFAMAALTGGRIRVPHLSRACKQGDIRFLGLLEAMGCQVLEKNGGIQVIGPQALQGLGEVDMSGFSDTFMTVAALSVFADSTTTLHGLAHTRLQESDRVAAIAEGLQRLGVRTESCEDSLTIYPGKPRGATVFSYNDHRIAMSLALIGLKAPGVIIENAEAVAKTCPRYFEMLAQCTQGA